MPQRRVRAVLFLALLAWHALSGTAAAQTSWGIGVLQNGTIFFCDGGRNIVWRISPSGERTVAFAGITCQALVSGPNGAIYGESTPSDLVATRGVGIWEINPAGARAWVMPPTLTPPPGAWLVRDSVDRQYAWAGVGRGGTQSQILRRDPLGDTVVIAGREWGQRDGQAMDAAFGNVTGLALAPDDSLVIVDSGNVRRLSLERVTTEARGVVTNSHLGLIGAPGLWGRELGVATDISGAAVVVDPEAGRIVHISRAGHVTPIWEPAGLSQRISGGRWGWRPAGVAMMGTTYYVLDEWMGPALLADLIGSPRLSQVDARGQVTRIVAVGNWTVRAAAMALAVVLLSLVLTRRRGAQASQRP